jgi:hypothetical protein
MGLSKPVCRCKIRECYAKLTPRAKQTIDSPALTERDITPKTIPRALASSRIDSSTLVSGRTIDILRHLA